MMRALSFAGAAVAALLLTGCVAAVIGNSPNSGTVADARARSAADADAALAGAVRARLATDSALRSAAIEVSAVGGAITLRGTVTAADGRSNAERLARSVAGVMAVNNQLKVK
jgi:osmotically-inducible protein OsmY